MKKIGKILHKAVKIGDKDKVKALINTGVDVNTKDKSGFTPLFHAVTLDENLREIVTLLIQNGANIIAKNKKYGLTPLLYASFAGYDESVELLIKNGANICDRDISEGTPLHLASNSKTAEVLIQNGASMKAKDYYEFTPFQKAVNNGNVELVKTFIKHGADV